MYTDKELKILQRIKNTEEMSIERLRNYPGFEIVSDVDAQNVIETLTCYSSVIINDISKI